MVTTTVVLSLLVILVLGTLLLNRVESGLLDAKVQAALAEAATGSRTAQDAFDSADRTDPTVYETVLRDLVDRLASAGGPAGANDVALLRGPQTATADAPLGASSFELRPATVPDRLRRAVQTTGDQVWTYGAISRAGGGEVPVVAIGSPVVIPTVSGPYELYFVFPLDKEQETLDLVRRTLALAALGLVLLVGGIAWLVTRQVVTPVRMAARIAERLAAGRLEERMRVRGEDDLARLAASFNGMATSLQRQIRQLEDLSRVQRRFVSDVSHELRTPLTTVRMAADVLHEARDALRPVGPRSAELLQNQLDRFEALLADLLEISRYDAGAALLEVEPTDVRRIAARVIEAAEPLAERRGSRVELDRPGRPVRRRGRQPPHRAGPAQPGGQRHRARRGPAHRRTPRCRRPGRRGRGARPRRRASARRGEPWSSTGSGAPTRPGRARPAAPGSACRSPWRTSTCTAAGCRRGASRAPGRSSGSPCPGSRGSSWNGRRSRSSRWTSPGRSRSRRVSPTAARSPSEVDDV